MASCLLNEYIITICQKQFGCKDDQDFPAIINFSFPFSPMLSVSDAQDNQKRIISELNYCLNEVSRGRGLVHWDCL